MRKLTLGLILFFYCTIASANLPYFSIVFPRDEGAHFENVPYNITMIIEWWYFNGLLTSDKGEHLSYDVAFFHPAIYFSGLYTKPILHVQIADLDHKKSVGGAINYQPNSGNVATDRLNISIDNYELKRVVQQGKVFYHLHAEVNDKANPIKLNLLFEPISKPFLINQNGLMPMSHETNSYYYSIPHCKTTGQIQVKGTSYQISKYPGDSWMDHQWGDFNVQKNGWEWFSIRLTNGLVANIFLNYEYESNKVVSGIANIILPSGKKYFIPYEKFKTYRSNYWFDKKLSASYPMDFTFVFSELGLEIKTFALFPEQELHGYWEGYCKVNAIYNKQELNGYSYMEIVYGSPIVGFSKDAINTKRKK